MTNQHTDDTYSAEGKLNISCSNNQHTDLMWDLWIDGIPYKVPNAVVKQATDITAFFAENNIKNWQLCGIESRDYAVARYQDALRGAREVLEFYSNNPKSYPDGGAYASKALANINTLLPME